VGSNCPTSKSVIIRLERPGKVQSAQAGGQEPVGADDDHERNLDTAYLS
jgi:hypothetical protein